MSAITIIRMGEDLEFVFDLDGEDISGWVCLIQVSRSPEDETAFISRIIPPVRRAWPGFLTADETSALPVSSTSPYFLTGFLTNSSTDQERQVPRRFNVTVPWAS